jgi:hypothetical protein
MEKVIKAEYYRWWRVREHSYVFHPSLGARESFSLQITDGDDDDEKGREREKGSLKKLCKNNMQRSVNHSRGDGSIERMRDGKFSERLDSTRSERAKEREMSVKWTLMRK